MLQREDSEDIQRQLNIWAELTKRYRHENKNEMTVVGRNSYLQNLEEILSFRRPLKSSSSAVLEEEPLKVTDRFTYSGRVLSSNGIMEQNIPARLGKSEYLPEYKTYYGTN